MTFDHRRSSVTVTVADGDATLSNSDVTIAQVRHAFEFGCAAFEVATEDEQYQQLWLDLFDTATLPFYWGRYEPVQGQTNRDRIMADAAWFQERNVRLKGHPLVWHTVKAPWLDAMTEADAEQLLRARIRREVADFRGIIDTWDAINEVVIMPRFTNEPDGVANIITRLCAAKGRVDMVALAIDEARAAGDKPRLLINDFDLGPEYEQLIEDLLAAGVGIDAIGLQSHMHQGFRGADQIAAICDRFARFGLPLHWTETTLLSGELVGPECEDLNDAHREPEGWPSTEEGEARQAEELLTHYRTLVGHPAVVNVTYWGIGDGHAWLNAPAGLLRRDGSPKPAYDALRDLVRGQWWMEPTHVRTNGQGQVQVEGFHGTYQVTASDGRCATFDLGPQMQVVPVQLR